MSVDTGRLQTIIDTQLSLVAGYQAALLADTANPQPSYSVDGRTVDRNQWRDSLLRQVEEGVRAVADANKLINALSPFIVRTRISL